MDNPLLIAVGGSVLLLVLLVLFVLSRIKVAGPNEAFIVTGRKGRAIQAADGSRATDLSGQKVVMGASVFVVPVVQKLQALDLSSRRIHVEIQGAVSKQGIRANLQGVAIVKVGGTEDAIRAAAQRFLGQQAGIDQFTSEVLAGALRAIVGRLTIEEIIRDRTAFASAVAEEAEHSLTNQGLVLDTFQLQDILAEGSYLQDLGRPEAARVLKEAAIAEARARQAAEQERLLAEEAIAEAQRNLALKQAGIQAEIDAAKARSAAAGPLAQAERDQAILAEQQKVAERNAELKERQLDTEVRKPADAARYKVEQEAEAARRAAVLRADAERQATIAAAQAQAEQARLVGEGERSRRAALAEATAVEGAKQGEAEQRRRTAIAEATEREGAAEASAILARGQAEAEAMRHKADAFGQYGEAAVLDLLVRVLPQVVEAASRPMGEIDKMTVISTDGASSLTRSVAANVAQGLQLGTDLTGIDLAKLLARLGGAAADEDAGNSRRGTAIQGGTGTAERRPG
jgi:flotillin